MGVDLKWYRPNGVIDVVSNADCLSRGICQNPELASIFENTFPPPSIASDCSTDGKICLSLQTARLSLVRSTHMRILPSGFGTITYHASTPWCSLFHVGYHPQAFHPF